MKKVLFAMLMLLNVVCGYSQNYNRAQENLRTEIAAYLKRQGLNPEKENDGLKFKSEGDTYYIEIDKEATEPMYLRVRRYVKYDTGFSKEKISRNLNRYNKTYCVKVFCQEKSFVLSAETFLTKTSEFSYIFDTIMSQMKSAYKSISE